MSMLDGLYLGLEEHYVSVNGFRTHYYTAGLRENPPVVLLHDGAWGADAFLSWGGVMRELSKKFWVVAPDMLGFGQTDKAAFFGEAHYNYRMRHVGDFCRTICMPGPAHFVGTSFGGSLVLRAAIDSNWSIASATSIAGTGGPWRSELSKRELGNFEVGRDYIEKIVALLANTTDGLDEHIERRYQNSLLPGHYACMMSPRMKHPADQSSPKEDNYPEGLRNVDFPVHIITMTEDKLVDPNWPLQVKKVAPNVIFHTLEPALFTRSSRWASGEQVGTYGLT